MIFAIFIARVFDLRKQQLMPRSSPVPTPAQSSGRRGGLKKGRTSMRLSNAARASAVQGRLLLQAAARCASQSYCTCFGHRRQIAARVADRILWEIDSDSVLTQHLSCRQKGWLRGNRIVSLLNRGRTADLRRDFGDLGLGARSRRECLQAQKDNISGERK